MMRATTTNINQQEGKHIHKFFSNWEKIILYNQNV